MTRLEPVAGLVPAAGRATRLALASGSKELLMVPDLDADPLDASGSRPKVPVCEYLLRQYRAAGINRFVVVRRAEKADVADYFARLAADGTEVIDVVVPPTPGSAHSIAHACSAVPDMIVVAGFPDIVLEPVALASSLVETLGRTGADVCVGNVPCPATQRPHWDLCEFDGERVTGLVFKPPADSGCDLEWGLCIAAWRPSFSEFLIDGLLGVSETIVAREPGKEISLGHCLLAGIEAGFDTRFVNAPAGFALDIGEPDRLAMASDLRRTREDRSTRAGP